ncbi:unnamed protein product [Dracunculus medinensis]|uniref:Ras-GAP domain-containing protein n=1 Tax=Dracunculus medinensis TaxID=318479 RepID=A0A0N4UQZ9_DRAME|nr:unnamed protein product [Dracunculus medinensis]
MKHIKYMLALVVGDEERSLTNEESGIINADGISAKVDAIISNIIRLTKPEIFKDINGQSCRRIVYHYLRSITTARKKADSRYETVCSGVICALLETNDVYYPVYRIFEYYREKTQILAPVLISKESASSLYTRTCTDVRW